MNQRKSAATEALSFSGILLAAGVVAVILTLFTSLRLDWTANQRYSLSDTSQALVAGLSDKMEVTAYFTADLPPPFNQTEQDVRDLLSEYQSASGGKLQVRFVSPKSDDEKEEAQEAGVQLVQHRAIEDGRFVAEEGFRGLVLEYLEKKETIPVIENGVGLEYAITTKIKQLAGDRTLIALLSDVSGQGLNQGVRKLRECLPTYEVREVSADDSLSAEEYTAALLIEPHDTLSDEALGHINRYVMEGGSLGIFGPRIKLEQPPPNPQMPMQMPPNLSAHDSGINKLLRPWGLVARNGVVLDLRAVDTWPARASIFGRQVQAMVLHPPAVLGFFDDTQKEHPASFGLDSAYQPFTSPLELTSETPAGVEATVLLSSSEDSWVGPDGDITLEGRVGRGAWNDSFRGAQTTGPTPMAVALEGKLPSAFSGGENPVAAPTAGENEARIVVNGGSFFMNDMWAGNRACEEASELIFLANTVDWLAQDNDLIAIRAKTVEDPKIDVPQPITRAEGEARQAAEAAQEAAAEEFIAGRTGNADKQEEAASKREAAQGNAEQALKRREAAVEAWESTKTFYRFGNMLGIPLLVGVFGIMWWFRRKSAKAQVEI